MAKFSLAIMLVSAAGLTAVPDAFSGKKPGDERTIAGIKLCWCPPGKFTMGSPPNEPERRPSEAPVEVTLTQGFWAGEYEVTQGDWKRIVGKLPGPLTAELPEGDSYPVGNVNFAEAEGFCHKLTELAHKSNELPEGWEFRLPTEAQWEFACRAGTKTATAFGDKLSSKQANFKGKPYNGAESGPSLGKAAQVGSYPANAWGLHDMHGNTFEWCRDWYRAKLPDGVDPDLHDAQSTSAQKRTGSSSRVRRGGAWSDDGWPCRSACRVPFEPERRADHIGFRVVAVKLTGEKPGDERTIAGIKLCWCPPGKFMMGSPRTESERRPGEDQVEVTLTSGFWAGKYEVTQGDWKRTVGALPGPLTAELPEGDDYPVGNVNFAEAEAFCLKLTELAHKARELPEPWEFRLPTEAQWEYACRAGTTTATAFGDKLSSKQANFKGKPYNGAKPGPSLGKAAKAGSYPANAWGLHDMHGNTFEWCRDWYHARLPGGIDPDLHDARSTAAQNRTGDSSRVRRGGAWTDDGWPCRSACRLRFEPERRYDHIGFRVVAVRR